MPDGPKDAPSQALLATAASLSVDRVTAEVVATLADRGIPAIVLKGPSVASWLYADGDVRPYGDTDLLIAPEHQVGAEESLRDLGFRYSFDADEPDASLPDRAPWVRGVSEVDLHVTLLGIGAPPSAVWATLGSRIAIQRVGGLAVRILDEGARTLLVGLHAAQHGRHEERPLEDLRRALASLNDAVWEDAILLARRLEAVESFALGLRLEPEGRRLADRFALPEGSTVQAQLLAETSPVMAFDLEELARLKGGPARARYVARRLFPSPGYLRSYSRMARRGRRGLAVAYAERPLRMLTKLSPALASWRTARRRAR